MVSQNKTLRYYQWLISEYFKKHFKLILLSFFLTVIFVLSTISIFPYLSSFFMSKKNIIGLVGRYDMNNLSDELYSNISNGLISINEKGEIIPALITSWEVVDNGREYHFQLRKDLLWNDGKPFNANNLGYNFKDIEIKATGEYQVTFKLKKSLGVFPTYLTKPVIKYPLVGVAGLYKVEKYVTNGSYIQEVQLIPNKKGLKPIVYKFYDNESRMINAYKLGEINQMSINRKSIADILKKWRNTTVSEDVDYTHLMTLFINLKNPLLKERNMRQAAAMAIDRSTLAKLYGLEAIGPIPPVSWAYNPNIKKTSYNQDTAKKIIEKDFDASSSAKINFVTFYEYLDVANEIDRYLNEAGLKTSLNIASFGQNFDYDLLLAYFKVPNDPDQYFFWHSTQEKGNISNYVNLKVDKLLEDARSVLNPADRKQKYFEFQKVMADDTPAVFIYYPYVYTVKRK